MKVTLDLGPDVTKWIEFLKDMVKRNIRIIKNDNLPSIYDAGIEYKQENRGEENWRTADQVFSDGYGDCEDLAAYRAAELQLAGIDAQPEIIPIKITNSRRSYHARVRLPDGSVDDPSITLDPRFRKVYKVDKPRLIINREIGLLSVPAIVERRGKSAPYAVTFASDIGNVNENIEDLQSQYRDYEGRRVSVTPDRFPGLPGFYPAATATDLTAHVPVMPGVDPLLFAAGNAVIPGAGFLFASPQGQQLIQRGGKSLKRFFSKRRR